MNIDLCISSLVQYGLSFGIFEVRSRVARKGKRPRLKEIIKIAVCKLPAFGWG